MSNPEPKDKPSFFCTSMKGELVEAGQDEFGNNRLVIYATEEQIKRLHPLPLYVKDVQVTFTWIR